MLDEVVIAANLLEPDTGLLLDPSFVAASPLGEPHRQVPASAQVNAGAATLPGDRRSGEGGTSAIQMSPIRSRDAQLSHDERSRPRLR